MSVDRERFIVLYEELYPRVLGYALHRVPSHAARDAVDEAFLIAWQKRDQMPSESALPWLLVVTRHVLANQRRRSEHQDVIRDELTRLSQETAAAAADAAVVKRYTVLSALGELTGREREALMLSVWDGLSLRIHLLLDPESGLLLAMECVGLQANAAAVGSPVATPATIRYVLWLDSALVKDTTSRP